MRRTMTHDELIAYIDDSTDGLKHEHLFEKLLANTKALRAVVELHKPIIYPQTTGLPSECTVCRAEPYYSSNEVYPCPTIQAIEKELS
jgi:hypothetical protein